MADRGPVTAEDLLREPGSTLAAIGALALLVSLWLPWFGRVSGWNVFEAWDVVLAALAVAALVVVAGRLEVGPRRPDGWLWVSGVSTVVIVVENLVNRPPIVQVASTLSGAGVAIGLGPWVALAAGVAMLAGAALVWRAA